MKFRQDIPVIDNIQSPHWSWNRCFKHGNTGKNEFFEIVEDLLDESDFFNSEEDFDSIGREFVQDMLILRRNGEY